MGDVEEPIVEDGRWHIGRAPLDFPEDGVRDVTFSRDRDGEKGIPLVAAHAVDDFAVNDRGRDAVAGQAFRFPDNLARVEVVAANLPGGGGDHLGHSIVLCDGRGRPRVLLLPILLPKRLPIPGVHYLDGGLPGVIANDHDLPVMHNRRTAFTQARAHFRGPKIAIPELLSIEIVSEHPGRSEPAVDPLPIADGRGRGEAGVPVVPLVGDESLRYVPPKLLSCLPVKAENDHLIAGVGMLDPKDPFRLILRLRPGRIDPSGVDGGDHEDSIAPHNRAGGAVAFDRHFPSNVFLLAPLQRWLRCAGNAVVLGAAPLVPILPD